MDLNDLDSLDVVEVVMALEEAHPDIKLPQNPNREEIMRFIQRGLDDDEPGDDATGPVPAVVRPKGPSGRGGATAVPEE